MASVNKVKIGSTTYDVSPSPAGTLDTTSSTKFTSNDVDQASATSYVSVNKIAATETNSSIFSKLTSMARNVRYLHNKVGTTDISSIGNSVTAAISALDTKAPPTHSHTTADLPVSNTQINSSSYIPTSSLIFSMNQTLTSLNDAITFGESITTNNRCGGIEAGTLISSSSTLQSIVKNMLYTPTAPTEYESKSLGTWSSLSNVNTFFNTYKPSNGWNGLKLGNYVKIQDGTYNTQWEIAGFNCEHNQLAADGTVYDNGYGICMIPKTDLGTMTWNNDAINIMGYKASLMHTSHLVTVANNLKTVLGTHLINRNVLLSNSVSSSAYYSNSYEWTTAYCTLMSVGQMTGVFAQHRFKYDDGEANYKLPLFIFNNYGIGSGFWSRCIYGQGDYGNYIWCVRSNEDIVSGFVYNTSGVRPLIYLR